MKCKKYKKMSRLLKGFLYLFLLLLFFQLNSGEILADGEFYVDANVHYVFDENGNVKITHNIVWRMLMQRCMQRNTL